MRAKAVAEGIGGEWSWCLVYELVSLLALWCILLRWLMREEQPTAFEIQVKLSLACVREAQQQLE
jgi:hypothetical protein